MSNQDHGEMFSKDLMNEIKDKFMYLDYDPFNGKRFYFENAGGALRLKKIAENNKEVISLPDASGRPNAAGKYLSDLVNKGKEDFKLLLGAKSGKIASALSSSKVLFQITGTIAENIQGTNIITTNLDHPGNYDAASYYATKTGKELRVADVNSSTGGVDAQKIIDKVDKNTCLLSFIFSSNITGAILDVENIIKEARRIKPDLFILIDAIQHVPHAPVDVGELNVDGFVMAPYKFFSNRGLGLGYISDRVANLPHEKALGKDKDNWDLGSIDPAGYQSFSTAVDYVCWIGKRYSNAEERRPLILEGMKRIQNHEKALLNRIIYGGDKALGLKKNDGVIVHFMEKGIENKDLIVAISIKNKDSKIVVEEYKKQGFIVFDRVVSSPFSQRTLKAFGLTSLIRVSPIHCNSPEDIDLFLKATETIAKG